MTLSLPPLCESISIGSPLTCESEHERFHCLEGQLSSLGGNATLWEAAAGLNGTMSWTSQWVGRHSITGSIVRVRHQPQLVPTSPRTGCKLKSPAGLLQTCRQVARSLTPHCRLLGCTSTPNYPATEARAPDEFPVRDEARSAAGQGRATSAKFGLRPECPGARCTQPRTAIRVLSGYCTFTS